MTHYLGYHIGNDGEGQVVSAALTEDEAQVSAIRRILSLCILYGEIAVRKNDSLSDEEFASLQGVLDKWFAAKGIQ